MVKKTQPAARNVAPAADSAANEDQDHALTKAEKEAAERATESRAKVGETRIAPNSAV